MRFAPRAPSTPTATPGASLPLRAQALVPFALALAFVVAFAAIGPAGWPLYAIGLSLAAILTAPFTTLIAVLLYFDLRIRKEAFDLEIMERTRIEPMRNMGVASTPAPWVATAVARSSRPHSSGVRSAMRSARVLAGLTNDSCTGWQRSASRTT